MEFAAAKARAQMSQNDFSPPSTTIQLGDSGRVWRMRHKFWLPSQMYSKRKEPLCAGGKAYGRSFLFACGVNGGASRMYLDRFYPSRRAGESTSQR